MLLMNKLVYYEKKFRLSKIVYSGVTSMSIYTHVVQHPLMNILDYFTIPKQKFREGQHWIYLINSHHFFNAFFLCSQTIDSRFSSGMLYFVLIPLIKFIISSGKAFTSSFV